MTAALPPRALRSLLPFEPTPEAFEPARAVIFVIFRALATALAAERLA